MLIREMLKAAGLPRLDAEVLLAHVLKRPRTWLMSHDDQQITGGELKKFEELAARRRKGEPASHITGEKEFFGRTFIVTPNTLVPRPATEELVACTLDFLKSPRLIEKEIDTNISALCIPLAEGKPEIIMDIGTGSGCIAATLKLEGRSEKILAVDISKEALEVAQQNFTHLNIDISCAQGDGAAFVRAMHQPFVIVSNPPYIPEGTELQNDVLDYEPHEALFSGPEGTDVLRAIAQAAADNPQCLGMALELRTEQITAVKRLLGVM
jgi:release factor glutamine methyltransferase